MLWGLAQLLLFQLAGEGLAHGLGLPIPGPVLGMGLLFGYLLWRGEPSAALTRTADGFLGILSLLFVPAGVGLVQHLHLLRAEWLPIAVAVVFGTALTLALTAGIFALLSRATSPKRGGHD